METKNPLAGKWVVLGVCGGIAAYKSAELARLLIKCDARVRVVMTRSAQKFVGAPTFAALTGESVYTDMWEETDGDIRHISWAREADLVIVAPATANSIARFACGLADDPLSTLMLATTSPVLVCPSMNSHMFEHAAVQKNMETLSGRGVHVMAPCSGFLACGDTGPGRLPEPQDIVDRAKKLVCSDDFAGVRVLVSAGPTREAIDPVRFISNPSSGKMGYAIARAAEYRGATVTLVSGPTALPDPMNMQVVRVTSAREMEKEVRQAAKNVDVVIKTAAVGDYRPESCADQKIKKLDDTKNLCLVRNPDILKGLGEEKGDKVLIGFAAETQELKAHATEKMAKKNLDMIVGNLIGGPDSGFGVETNRVTCFFSDGKIEVLDVMSKDSVAHCIMDRARALLDAR